VHRRRWVALILAAALGCATGRNYMQPNEPRFAGGPSDTTRSAADGAARVAAGALRIVTFNIRFAQNIDAAIRLLGDDADLRGADLIALQEMDEEGVQRIAAALSLWYVYYPATLHPSHERNFGNAILSRWPLAEDRKILLPHLGDVHQMQRIAVAGTIVIGTQRIRVYSLHLGTMFELDPDRRADQFTAVLDDAAESPDPVIIAGDLNSHGVGDLAAARGYAWPTRDAGRTKWLFSWDHIFLRGFPPGAVLAAGRTRDAGGASDHRAVWTVVDLGARAGTLGGPADRVGHRPARRDGFLAAARAAGP
jgi:endonuclease/exonuclease/phosphatase family metal-dependent hydrolase